MSLDRKPDPIRLHKELTAIWETPPGWARLSAVNHTTLGKRFIITAFVFFAIGGLLAMLIRVQIATSSTAFVSPELYGQFFTMHGTVMMFLFAIPMFEGFAMYLLPKILGARDLAFPRLSAYGFWCYLFGGSILIVALLLGAAPDSGWFMYTPLSSSTYSPGINNDIWLLGITFVEISALSAAIEIIVSILRLRAPGMSLERMPIMAWYLLITAMMMLFGFPPLILGSILLELERAFDLPFFDPTRGGDSLLWQHLFWLFGHPEVYIIFLPAAGAISMMIPTFARHELVGYTAIVVAVVAVAFLSFGLWVHHMFTVGIPHLALAFFSAASGLVAIPTGVQIFAWIATLAQGRRPRWDVPMLYLGGFLFIFVLGGLTGVMVAMVPFNWQAHDTHFVVAHLHYVLVGGFVFPMMAATYYWLPHFTGRVSDHKISIPAFWLIFGGFNLTFFLMHLTGLRGMPRRIDAYPAEAGWDWLNLISSIGGFVMAAGFALFVVDLVLQVRFGTAAPRNPWGARTAEWAMPTPPPAYAFASLPQVQDRADRLDPNSLGTDLAAGKGYLPFARNGWMETLGVDMATGKPGEVIVLPNRTYKPLISGVLTCAFVLCLLFKFYWASLLVLALVVGSLLGWASGMGSRRDCALLEAGRGLVLPPHWQTERPPSWWAMVLVCAADATLFASLLFGGLFLWLVAPAWPPPLVAQPSLTIALFAAMMVIGASLSGRLAVSALRQKRSAIVMLRLAGVAQAAGFATFLLMALQVPDPTAHAHLAVIFVVLIYAAIHAGIGVILALHGLWRWHGGYLSALRSLDLRIAQLWHYYAAVTAIISLLATFLFAFLASHAEGPRS
ncbi:cytochrome c oxidase subunit I [Aquamicrobium zhengzhouense]|uniref:cytochrome-c oxidase n=1 Tax=Aquamicrobium zhengzhouense TaxID=2781738 RepID=A0ABS0SCG3_9HYPH|nr:cytochrome c oxidase subunit I [Aquamicrobium zhengzhouense]MBI1620990.1 cytochrome c oxidase subunit I [Aquamicrobium zhengzhouense]